MPERAASQKISRHFTVLLPVVNRGNAPDGLSHAWLRTKIGGGEAELQTPPIERHDAPLPDSRLGIEI